MHYVTDSIENEQRGVLLFILYKYRLILQPAAALARALLWQMPQYHGTCHNPNPLNLPFATAGCNPSGSFLQLHEFQPFTAGCG
jgi:hypothetical protein